MKLTLFQKVLLAEFVLQYTTRFFALALIQSSSSSSSSPNKSSFSGGGSIKPPLLDVEGLKTAIARGRVYQHFNFLTEDQVQILLQEIKEVEIQNKFERKGLSNKGLGQNQTFDIKLDRSICPVPWFFDALEGKDTREIPSLLRQLETFLSETLNRPSIRSTRDDIGIYHECYYSKSEVGSRLPRHMDEKHEEAKGPKGWMTPTRRSLSWLIYLSTPADWTLEENGGALRTFPQRFISQQQPKNNLPSTTHDGNLQVGWLVGGEDGQPSFDDFSRPVYLDSWYPVMGIVMDSEGSVPEPHCILYVVNDSTGKREFITRPWLTEQLQGLAQMDFMKLCAEHDPVAVDGQNEETPLLFLKKIHAKAFAPLEDRMGWDRGEIPRGSETVDILPLRGSLVIFDSVQLPHEVEIIKEGTRLALAGWFHEKTQEFPETFYG